MPTDVEIDEALEAVVTAAQRHRALLATDAATPEQIWLAYIALNNASVHYDDLISDAYDEVTPWDCEYIEDDAPATVEDAPAAGSPTVAAAGSPAQQTATITVRQRRDYVAADVPALLATAAQARRKREGADAEVAHLGQAIYALIDAGDGTMSSLDFVEELEPGNGVMLINELVESAPVTGTDDADDPQQIFQLKGRDRLLYRLDELMVTDDDATVSS